MSPEEKVGVVAFTNGGDGNPGRYVEADGVDGSPPRMPEPDYALTGRGFRLRWVVASAAGMAVAGAVARPLSYVVGGAVGEVLGEIPAEAAIGAVAGGGVLGGIGLAQWLLLRRRVHWAGLWPVAGALAGPTRPPRVSWHSRLCPWPDRKRWGWPRRLSSGPARFSLRTGWCCASARRWPVGWRSRASAAS